MQKPTVKGVCYKTCVDIILQATSTKNWGIRLSVGLGTRLSVGLGTRLSIKLGSAGSDVNQRRSM